MLKSIAKVLIQGLSIIVISVLLFELVLQGLSLFVDKESRADTALDEDVISIVTLGDSNTYGLFVERTEAWPVLVEQKLLQAGYPVKVTNLGYPGTNSTLINKNFESVYESIKPDLILIMVGVNDYWNAPILEEENSGLLQWLQVNSRVYKAFRIFYFGQIKKQIRPIEEADRFVEEHNVMTPEELTEYAQSVPEKFKIRTVVNGQLLELGLTSQEVTDEVKQASDYIHANFKTTLDYSFFHILKKLEGKHAKLILLTYPSEREWYGRVNKIKQDISKDYDIPLIDVRINTLVNCPANDLECDGHLFSDQHASPKGYKVVAEKVYQSLLGYVQKINNAN